MNQLFSRRKMIKTGMLTTLGAPFVSYASFGQESLANMPDDPWKGFKPGIASYTFRKFSVDDTIKAMNRLGLKYISIKDFHLSLKSTVEERKAVINKFRDAGITPLSCGNITLPKDEAGIRNAFEYARDCGIPTIVCSPDPGSMAILDKMVKEFDIKLAIHNHGPEDKIFPSPNEVWEAVKQYDSRIGLCIDVGHTARAKVDPAKAILKFRERLYDLHFKDITSTEPSGETTAGGRGVLDLRSVIRALLKIQYGYLFSIEYESSPDDPLPEVAETIGYAKGLIKGLS
jgi:inosose dehydratase